MSLLSLPSSLSIWKVWGGFTSSALSRLSQGSFSISGHTLYFLFQYFSSCSAKTTLRLFFFLLWGIQKTTKYIPSYEADSTTPGNIEPKEWRQHVEGDNNLLIQGSCLQHEQHCCTQRPDKPQNMMSDTCGICTKVRGEFMKRAELKKEFSSAERSIENPSLK